METEEQGYTLREKLQGMVDEIIYNPDPKVFQCRDIVAGGILYMSQDLPFAAAGAFMIAEGISRDAIGSIFKIK